LGEAAGATDQSTNPREDFFDAEGFGDIVVGSSIDSLHFLVPTTARRQNKHGRRNPCLSPTAEQSETIDSRQTQVQHYGVELPGRDEKIGLFAIRSAVNGVPGILECPG
jgi:hypothetical protein